MIFETGLNTLDQKTRRPITVTVEENRLNCSSGCCTKPMKVKLKGSNGIALQVKIHIMHVTTTWV